MELLFKTKIGYGEDELGVVSKNGIVKTDSIVVSYKNGFFYIADNINNKIVRTTERGEILLVIYNPDFNPSFKPTTAKSESETETVIFVKLYKDYPVYNPTKICADIEKNIYFVNNLPSYKKIEEDGSFASQMVLKFSNKGEILFELGKNGIGTSPFGYINNISTDEKDNLIIQEDSNDGIIFYKFTKLGILEKKVKITKGDIPLTAKENDYLVEIIDSKIGSFENDIYVTCQFVKEVKDMPSLVKYETVYEKILKYSISSHKFERLLLKVTPQYFDLSKYAGNSEIKDLYGDKQKVLKPMEALLGMDENYNLFLSQKDFTVSKANINN
ncbi:MAG TPA: hypothetical protein PK771_16230, partial [Spirochaetota bacterium]|nr:hypothetical protein [Spirochaetota bacterium]